MSYVSHRIVWPCVPKYSALYGQKGLYADSSDKRFIYLFIYLHMYLFVCLFIYFYLLFMSFLLLFIIIY